MLYLVNQQVKSGVKFAEVVAYFIAKDMTPIARVEQDWLKWLRKKKKKKNPRYQLRSCS